MKTYINTLLIAILVGGFMCSCSNDNDIDINGEPKGGASDASTVSISFALPDANAETKGSGNYPGNPANQALIPSEAYVYSVDVLIFKSDGTIDKGDTKKSWKRVDFTPLTSAGNPLPSYDKYYKNIVNEAITGIEVSAGKGRDIYIIANAPAGTFDAVTTLDGLKAKLEDLSQQGVWKSGVKPAVVNNVMTSTVAIPLLAHPDGTKVTLPSDGPIGGITPSDLNTRLTMCAVIKDVTFDNTSVNKKHTIGGGVAPADGSSVPTIASGPLKDPVVLTRLVARVAIKSIKFELPVKPNGKIQIGAIEIDKAKVSYHLDGLSLINARKEVKFFDFGTVTDNFAHGDAAAQTALTPGASSELASLYEGLNGTGYEIANNKNIPLWFYTFENKSTTRVTSFVVGVKYNYIDPTTTKAMTVKYYYLVPIKKTGVAASILPNHQYALSVTIKGTNAIKNGGAPAELKSLSADEYVVIADESNLDIDTEIGTNLFPWAGDKYIINK